MKDKIKFEFEWIKHTVSMWLKSKYFWENLTSRYRFIIAAIDLGIGLPNIIWGDLYQKLAGILLVLFSIYFCVANYADYLESDEYREYLDKRLDELTKAIEEIIDALDEVKHDER